MHSQWKPKSRHKLLLRWISEFKGLQSFVLGQNFNFIENKFWFSYEQEAKVYCYIHFAPSPEMLSYLRTFWGHKHLVFLRTLSPAPYGSLATYILCSCCLSLRFPWENTPVYVTICFMVNVQSIKSHHSKAIPQILLTKASSTILTFKINIL